MTPAPGRPNRLVFAGEAIVDVVMRVPALPPRGGDLLATSSEVAVGGGFNVMAAAARQGMPVLYAGGHGTGPWGDLVRAALAAEGIALLRPPDPARDTGFDVALVEPDAERTFVTSLGAESAVDVAGWDAIPAGPGDAVYVSGYGLAAPGSAPALAAWAAALPPPVLLFFDPGPLVAELPPALLDPVLARCDWLSANAREAALLTPPTPTPQAPTNQAPADQGRTDPHPAFPELEQTAARLLARASRASVLVRVGPAGCFLAIRPPESQERRLSPSAPPPVPDAASADHGALVHIPAPKVKAVDTTGAGDAHAGVFLAALAEGLSPAGATRRANAAAALAVTRPGPATAPSRADLDAWLDARLAERSDA